MTYYGNQPSFVASYYCSNCGTSCHPSTKSCQVCKESPDRANLVKEGKGFRKSWERGQEEEEV